MDTLLQQKHAKTVFFLLIPISDLSTRDLDNTIRPPLQLQRGSECQPPVCYALRCSCPSFQVTVSRFKMIQDDLRFRTAKWLVFEVTHTSYIYILYYIYIYYIIYIYNIYIYKLYIYIYIIYISFLHDTDPWFYHRPVAATTAGAWSWQIEPAKIQGKHGCYVCIPWSKGWFKQNPSNLSVRAEEKEYPFIDCQHIPDFVILVSFFVWDISLLAELGN